jgi:hypothetical protein
MSSDMAPESLNTWLAEFNQDYTVRWTREERMCYGVHYHYPDHV